MFYQKNIFTYRISYYLFGITLLQYIKISQRYYHRLGTRGLRNIFLYFFAKYILQYIIYLLEYTVLLFLFADYCSNMPSNCQI